MPSRAWKGVLDLSDPYAVPPSYLQRLRNMYLPKPGAGGAYQRPGASLVNPSAPFGAADSGRYGQGMVAVALADGTVVNFLVVGGSLYRLNADLTAGADVTPTGGTVAIDAGARVFLTSYANTLIVQDDVNTPWVGTDLTSTPITGTLIDYESDGSAWRASGPAVIYDDGLMFLVRYTRGESRVSRIAWSEPDDPLTGYHQTDFDNEWDVIENSDEPIYGLWATNLAIYYVRNDAIGYLSGALYDPEGFKTTATKDAIDAAIGSRAPASFVGFGNWLFFIDTDGRPQRLTVGGAVAPLWPQLQRVVDAAAMHWPDATARTAIGALVPELDLYVVAIWSLDPTQGDPQLPTTLYVFTAATGIYLGEWLIGAAGSPIAIHAIGTLVGVNGEKVVAVLGTDVGATAPQVPGAGGFLWLLHSIEDGVWTDNGAVPDVFATVGGAPPDDTMLTVDQVVAVVQALQTDPTPRVIEIVD